ncbi:MAG TPA: hypothetical protein VIM53_00630 [Candidatus Saccharimonadales bacterium]
MPFVHIDYNDAIVSEAEARQLAEALQPIVAKATRIDDVNVYANSAPIEVNVLPIEVLIRMSARLIDDKDKLAATLREEIAAWKTAQSFPHRINFYLIPMHWKVESGI